MKKAILAFAALSLASCTQRGCQSLEKQTQITKRDYEIIMYSGGAPVYRDRFNGYVNPEEKSDGVFYFKSDTLIEVSGDYIIKSTN